MGNLNSQQIIIGLIAVCVLMLVWSIWKKELCTIIVKIGVGIIIIWTANLLLPAIAIGINAITLGIVGILGIPGIIMLYIIQGLL
ncbi:MAG TPA: hypothetical protein GX707_18640 [Epulopiscium sp.]|nr:hypothetical protein [Candidatus Epulonipiscium sp.]